MPVGPSLQQAEIAKSVAGGGRLVILISTGCAPSHQILAKSEKAERSEVNNICL